MALQRPYDISIKGRTIDANEPNEIKWKVSGDIQTAFKIDILSNIDNSEVWTSGKITTYALKHVIPSSSLVNGKEYKILVTIYNQTGSSITSDAEIFQTSSTPVINVNPIGTVNSFSYNFSATYEQAEGVPLRNYTVNLFDDKKNLIDKSNIKTILPMEHLFTNLQTEKQYYIQFLATSSKGLTGDSGLILFDVFFYRPKMNVNLKANNIENAGIEVSWYVSQIIGETDGAPFVNGEKIDTSSGKKVWFDEGFEINQDYSMKLWIEQPYMSNVVEQVDLVRLNGTNGDIRIQYWDDRKFHVWKTVNGLKSHWVSEEVIGGSFVVLIQQVNKDMNITSEVIA
ncbi:hypothetical protein [Bacillus infantis]|uniref:hypothetical protein n=1 Tax=Bacillus infantis TaxID=324767 RepID=UPI003CE7E917